MLQKKKFSEKNGIVLTFFLQISLMSGLIEHNWILISTSALNQL